MNSLSTSSEEVLVITIIDKAQKNYKHIFEYSSLMNRIHEKKPFQCKSVCLVNKLFFIFFLVTRTQTSSALLSLTGWVSLVTLDCQTQRKSEVKLVKSMSSVSPFTQSWNLFLFTDSGYGVPWMKFQSILAVSIAISPIPSPTPHTDSFHRCPLL